MTDSAPPDVELIRLGRELDSAVADESRIDLELGDRNGTEAENVDFAAAHNAVWAVIDKILEHRATSLDGAAVKARAIVWAYRDEWAGDSEGTDQDILRSLVIDLVFRHWRVSSR